MPPPWPSASRRNTEAAAEDGTITWRQIHLEELAEAFAESDLGRLRAELIQGAAVAVAWVESIDRQMAQGAQA